MQVGWRELISCSHGHEEKRKKKSRSNLEHTFSFLRPPTIEKVRHNLVLYEAKKLSQQNNSSWFASLPRVSGHPSIHSQIIDGLEVVAFGQ